MLRTFAMALGLGLIVIGILGFLPEFTSDGLLFGTFKVNAMTNVFHLVTGIFALVSGMLNRQASKIYFILFGLLYGIIAVLGFAHGDALLLNKIQNNEAGTWLHTAIAVGSLYLGIFFKG